MRGERLPQSSFKTENKRALHWEARDTMSDDDMLPREKAFKQGGTHPPPQKDLVQNSLLIKPHSRIVFVLW